MKVVDLNVLLYAVDADSPHHAVVAPHWNELLNGDESVGLPWVVITGFLRLTTNPRVSARPFTPETACRYVDADRGQLRSRLRTLRRPARRESVARKGTLKP